MIASLLDSPLYWTHSRFVMLTVICWSTEMTLGAYVALTDHVTLDLVSSEPSDTQPLLVTFSVNLNTISIVVDVLVFFPLVVVDIGQLRSQQLRAFVKKCAAWRLSTWLSRRTKLADRHDRWPLMAAITINWRIHSMKHPSNYDGSICFDSMKTFLSFTFIGRVECSKKCSIIWPTLSTPSGPTGGAISINNRLVGRKPVNDYISSNSTNRKLIQLTK